MKLTFAVAALLYSSRGFKVGRKEPWDPATLPPCPDDSRRTVMDDGKTHVTKYPLVGASCVAQMDVPESNLIFTTNTEPADLEPCPSNLLQTHMANGEPAIAYPNSGYTCRGADFSLAQKKMKELPECPDDADEKVDGEEAVEYPKEGANCRRAAALYQKKGSPGSHDKSDPTAGLPECPNSEDDDQTIKGNEPVPYPKPGANCVRVDSLVQKHGKPAKGSGDPTAGLPECPNAEDDDNTVNGAAVVAYPKPGANCVRVDSLAQKKGKPAKGSGDPTAGLPECPNAEDDDNTVNGAAVVAYPKPGANCVRVDSLAQKMRNKKDWGKVGKSGLDPTAGLPECPNTEDDDNTVGGKEPVPYPKPDANCIRVDSLVQKKSREEPAPTEPGQSKSEKQKVPPFDPRSVEHCPDFDERMTLTDGKTLGVPYPNPGYNCQHNWSLGQLDPRYETPGRKLGDIDGVNRREDMGQRDATFNKPYINTPQKSGDPRYSDPGFPLGDIQGVNRREDALTQKAGDPRYADPGFPLGDIGGVNRRDDALAQKESVMKGQNRREDIGGRNINTAQTRGDPRYSDPGFPLGDIGGVNRRDDALVTLDPRYETPGRKLGDIDGTNRREDMGQRDATFMKPYINTAQLDPRYETPGRKLGDIDGTNRREDMGQRDATFMKPYINTAQLDPRYETPGRKLGDIDGTNRREDMGQRDATFMKPYINTAQLDPRYETPGRKLGDIDGTNRREDMGQRDATFMKPYINTAQVHGDPRVSDPGFYLGDVHGVSRRDDALVQKAAWALPDCPAEEVDLPNGVHQIVYPAPNANCMPERD